jgi:hypothetical protein
MKRVSMFLSAIACMGLAATSAWATNLLVDPGFESQTSAPNPNPTDVPGWANFGGTSFLNTPLAHSGNWVLDTPDNGGGYNVPGTYQEFAASPGQVYTFSAYVYTPNALVSGSNDFAILQLSWFTGANTGGSADGTNGVNVGTPAGGGGLALPQGVWTLASVTATAPAGTNSLGVYLLDINADANADFYFDDASLTLAPEPATFSLLSIASLAALRRKR